MNDSKKQALGRGLSSLLTSSDSDEKETSPPSSLPITAILSNPHQPRRLFSDEELEGLAASIQEKGILQPILVRPHPTNAEKYQIVAGERRWRAAHQVGLDELPVIIKNFSDAEALEVGLLENVQRQDLNPIEEAEALRQLAEEFHHTQEYLARILGKSRSHIANTLRLLALPKKVQVYLVEGKLSAGHGRTLVNAEDPERLAKMILEENLSVRQAESYTRQKRTKTEGEIPQDPEREILQTHLSDLLGTPVDLIFKGKGGKIMISFQNLEALDQLVQRFNQSKSQKPQQFTTKIWSV